MYALWVRRGEEHGDQAVSTTWMSHEIATLKEHSAGNPLMSRNDNYDAAAALAALAASLALRASSSRWKFNGRMLW